MSGWLRNGTRWRRLIVEDQRSDTTIAHCEDYVSGARVFLESVWLHWQMTCSRVFFSHPQSGSSGGQVHDESPTKRLNVEVLHNSSR